MTRWHRVVWQLCAHVPEAPRCFLDNGGSWFLRNVSCCYSGPHFVASPAEGQTYRYAYRLALLFYFVMFDAAGCVCVNISFVYSYRLFLRVLHFFWTLVVGMRNLVLGSGPVALLAHFMKPLTNRYRRSLPDASFEINLWRAGLRKY